MSQRSRTSRDRNGSVEAETEIGEAPLNMINRPRASSTGVSFDSRTPHNSQRSPYTQSLSRLRAGSNRGPIIRSNSQQPNHPDGDTQYLNITPLHLPKPRSHSQTQLPHPNAHQIDQLNAANTSRHHHPPRSPPASPTRSSNGVMRTAQTTAYTSPSATLTHNFDDSDSVFAAPHNNNNVTSPSLQQQQQSNHRQNLKYKHLSLMDPDDEAHDFSHTKKMRKKKKKVPKPYYCNVEPRTVLIVGLLVLLLFAAGVSCAYFIAKDNDSEGCRDLAISLDRCQSERGTLQRHSHRERLEEIHKDYVSKMNYPLPVWLKDYSNRQIYVNSPWDKSLVEDLVSHLKNLSVFDDVRIENYTVLLPLPSTEEGNLVEVMDRETGNVLYSEGKTPSTQDSRKKRAAKDELSADQVQPFVAYSSPGTAEGEVVNLNEGRVSDFDHILNSGVVLEGRIGIFRASNFPLLDVLRLAENHSLEGLLLYDELPQHSDTGSEGSAGEAEDVLFDSLNANGDPQTPGYASLDSVWKEPLTDQSWPAIPVQPISQHLAHFVLSKVSGQLAPSEWIDQSQFNRTLYIGRKSSKPDSWLVSMRTTQEYHKHVVQNVLATLRGHTFPDQVVMVGCSRTSFYTTTDQTQSPLYQILRMIEPLREFFQWQQTPKRTLTFSFWGGSEYGDIGLVEHFEQYQEEAAQVVTYLDMDTEVSDFDDTLLASYCSETLYDLLSTQQTEFELSLRDRDMRHTSPALEVFLAEVFDDIDMFSLEELEEAERRKFPLEKFLVPQVSVKMSNTVESSMRGNLSNRVTDFLTTVALSMADQDIIQYDDASSAESLQFNINKLLRQTAYIDKNLKASLRQEGSRLVQFTAVFDHMIDNFLDYSDLNHLSLLNRVLLRLNRQIKATTQLAETLQRQIKQITRLPWSSDLDLDGANSPSQPPHNGPFMRQISDILIQMRTMNDMLRSVDFRVVDYKSPNQTVLSVDAEPPQSLEEGWV